MFHLLFPKGPIFNIPGKTLRQKAQTLLFSHERIRVGNVAAQMILFLFDLISKNENFFFHTIMKGKQYVDLPSGFNRNIPASSLVRTKEHHFICTGIFNNKKLHVIARLLEGLI